MSRYFTYLLSLALILLTLPTLASTTTEVFLSTVFQSKPIEKKIWLVGEKKKTVTNILNHPYKQIRVGYWTSNNMPETRVWLLQEIGKEKYIDVGIEIKNNQVQKLRILAFRESRGWEVKLPFFTEQFNQNKLTSDNKLQNQVNSISGATLSWRAVTKLARMALYLDSQLK